MGIIGAEKLSKESIVWSLVGKKDSFFNDSRNIGVAYKIIANDVNSIVVEHENRDPYQIFKRKESQTSNTAHEKEMEKNYIHQAIEELKTNTGKRNQTKIVGKLLSNDSITHDNAVTELKLMVQIKQKEEARRRNEKTPEIEHLERMNAILDCATREQALEIAVTPEELHYVDEMFGGADDGGTISK